MPDSKKSLWSAPDKDPDWLVVQKLRSDPKYSFYFNMAEEHIRKDIFKGRFNRERGEELYRFALDHALVGFFGEIRAPHKVMFPMGLRKACAGRLMDEFFARTGRVIEDQRPARKGILAFIFGK
jgi:hypothetical protein